MRGWWRNQFNEKYWQCDEKYGLNEHEEEKRTIWKDVKTATMLFFNKSFVIKKCWKFEISKHPQRDTSFESKRHLWQVNGELLLLSAFVTWNLWHNNVKVSNEMTSGLCAFNQ